MRLLSFSAGVLLMLPLGIASAQTSLPTLDERIPQSPQYYFSGQKVAIPLVMVSSRNISCEMRFRLFQLAKDLGVPLSPVSLLESDFGFRADVPLRVAVPLLLPLVKTKTPALLKLEVREKGTEKWLPAGQVTLLIHPPENIAAETLQKSASELAIGGIFFAVFGKDSFFPDLLNELKIPFERVENIDAVPRATGMVCLGGNGDWNLPPSATRQKKLIRLIYDINHPEGIFIAATPDNFEAKINLLHPETLSKPARWDLLSELFLQLQQTASLQPGKTTL